MSADVSSTREGRRLRSIAPTLFGFLLFSQAAISGGLEKFPWLVVSDPWNTVAQPESLRVTYLGVNGYRFETADHVLLVDPYFTRIGFWSVELQHPIASQKQRVDEGFSHIDAPADAILVTHAHFDHLLDVPDLMERTGARFFSGPTAVNLVRSLGVDGKNCETVKPGNEYAIGPWTIHVLRATHDRLGSSIPFPGTVDMPAAAPIKARDWKVGEPLAFVIEGAGQRIYVDSGGTPGNLPEIGTGKIDLAILGVALPDSRRRYADIVRQLQPRYILPSHQDDFFLPLRRGFVFGKLTNFPEILRAHKKQHLPGRIILLDYFRPWTLR
jgi:L-ascorbate metabolism protein UlaG (beta-lactamase superfamily)